MKTQQDSTYVFEKAPVPTALRMMALPTIFGQLVILVYNLADTFYVGRTGNPLMVAGVSLILPVFNVAIAIAGLTGTGGGAYIARLLGRGDLDEAKKVSGFSISFAFAVALLFSLTMWIFMEPILRLMGAGDDILEYSKQYVTCVIVLGGIPAVMANVFTVLLRSSGISKQAGFGVAMGGILNIFLDPLFMFVLLPKGYEIVGVGIATLLSNIIACIYYLCVIRKYRDRCVVNLRPTLVSRRSAERIFNVGVPAALIMLLFDLDYMIIDRLMADYSSIALAAIGIVLKAERFPLNVGVGLCQGMDPLIGYNYASGNHERMHDVRRLTLAVGLAVGLVSITLYEIFAPNIIRFFIDDPETVAIGAGFLRARSPATIVMFMSFFVVHLFQAVGRGEISLRLGLLRWVVLNIPMLFILNHFFGVYGIVWAELTADSINAAISFAVYGKFKKKMDSEERTEV